jgi:hypothetical protein
MWCAKKESGHRPHEARHVAFGRRVLRDFTRSSPRSSGTREEFAVEASYLMRVRMMPADIWEAPEQWRHGK